MKKVISIILLCNINICLADFIDKSSLTPYGFIISDKLIINQGSDNVLYAIKINNSPNKFSKNQSTYIVNYNCKTKKSHVEQKVPYDFELCLDKIGISWGDYACNYLSL
jgi:hypothetical protein